MLRVCVPHTYAHTHLRHTEHSYCIYWSLGPTEPTAGPPTWSSVEATEAKHLFLLSKIWAGREGRLVSFLSLNYNSRGRSPFMPLLQGWDGPPFPYVLAIPSHSHILLFEVGIFFGFGFRTGFWSATALNTQLNLGKLPDPNETKPTQPETLADWQLFKPKPWRTWARSIWNWAKWGQTWASIFCRQKAQEMPPGRWLCRPAGRHLAVRLFTHTDHVLILSNFCCA